jgi:RimJ/RimL family protein N-acetyltransferase
MTSPVWPLFDLRLTTPDLAIRPMTESDLAEVAQVIPDDLEVDPGMTRFDRLDAGERLGVNAAQTYWRALGGWTVDAWKLVFSIRYGGRIVGSQALEGDDFLRLRTVDSWSYLARDARGRGWGKQMRRAVLTLAFDHLGAEYAITSAWQDNHASLGVSRSLGYADNGIERHRRDDGDSIRADDMVHLRMSREQWEHAGGSDGISVEGFEPCRPFFGLSAD